MSSLCHFPPCSAAVGTDDQLKTRSSMFTRNAETLFWGSFDFWVLREKGFDSEEIMSDTMYTFLEYRTIAMNNNTFLLGKNQWLTGELSHENMISSQVKITCYLHK